VLTCKRVGALTNPTITPDTSPRGIKRSRSPDTYGDLTPGDGLGDDGTSLLAKKFCSLNSWCRRACGHVRLRAVLIVDNLLMMSHFR
jgi:hypothetical protein